MLKLCKIRRPSKTGIRSAILCANGSFLPPWCLPGASQAVQLILSCLPGASQAVQMVLSYLPGASLVPRWLSDGSFPASLVPRKLSNESFPASLVPLRLSRWSFPASLAPPFPVKGNSILCSEQPTVEPAPGFAANRADRH